MSPLMLGVKQFMIKGPPVPWCPELGNGFLTVKSIDLK